MYFMKEKYEESIHQKVKLTKVDIFDLKF